MVPIGFISSPFSSLADMPIQPSGGAEVEATIVIKEEYEQGLNDLEGFSHVYLLYEFHKAERVELEVVPFMDNSPKGVFATRSPLRPNHIGLSIVALVKREKNELTIRGVDILDGTPLLDIKPYIPQFDHIVDATSGWLKTDSKAVAARRSDSRFT